ncbi:MAG: hypothetical protein ABW076_00010 [Candidatus Thiodiazotropha sp.]
MSFTDDSIDVVVALGKGIYSVGQDIALGVERTGEGLGLGEDGRVSAIGRENNAMVSLIERFVKYGVSDQSSPLYKSIVYVLEHYYSCFPDQAIDILAKQAGIGAGYTVGRMVVGKKLATAVASRIAVAIAASAAYKQLARRIGVSAGASTTGIGTPIGLLMMQGLLQRSSHAAMRLRMKSPKLYAILQRNGDLHLLYFLLEKPLEKYVQAISTAERNNAQFQSAIKRKYRLN